MTRDWFLLPQCILSKKVCEKKLFQYLWLVIYQRFAILIGYFWLKQKYFLLTTQYIHHSLFYLQGSQEKCQMFCKTLIQRNHPFSCIRHLHNRHQIICWLLCNTELKRKWGSSNIYCLPSTNHNILTEFWAIWAICRRMRNGINPINIGHALV